MEHDKHPDAGSGSVGHVACSSDCENITQSERARRSLHVCSTAVLTLGVIIAALGVFELVWLSGPFMIVVGSQAALGLAITVCLSREVRQGRHLKLTIGLLLAACFPNAMMAIVIMVSDWEGMAYWAVFASIRAGMCMAVACIAIWAHVMQARSGPLDLGV